MKTNPIYNIATLVLIFICFSATAQTKFVPQGLAFKKETVKRIDARGDNWCLTWSDAMKNAEGKSHSTNYLWNQMEIEIKVAE